jgi:flagellar hook-associated protein 2
VIPPAPARQSLPIDTRPNQQDNQERKRVWTRRVRLVGLRFDPVGGGQFKQAVQQLIEVEKQPLKGLEARKGVEESKMKLFQDFKGRFSGLNKILNDFTDFRKFRELKVDLGDGTTLMSVSVDKDKAEPGTYQIQINELAERSSIISNAFPDPDEKVLGVGYITLYSANGDKHQVFVDEKSSSLRGVAALLNRQDDAPVRASVIQDAADPENQWKLLLSAKKSGADEGIEFPEFYFVDGSRDFYTEDYHDAQNALLYIDGFPVETNGNQVADFLSGVSVELKGAQPEKPFTLKITEDYAKVSGKVKSLVDEANKILEFINKQNQIDQSSDTRSTFAGDTSLQNIEFQLRNLVHEPMLVLDADGEVVKSYRMNQLGVEFEKTGLLTFKEEKFTKALERDFEGVGQAITGEAGFGAGLKRFLDGYTRGATGLLATREQGIRTRIKEIDNQIDMKNRQIDRKIQSITDTFSKLQSTIGSMQRQQQYLSSSLGGGGGNMIGQLLG